MGIEVKLLVSRKNIVVSKDSIGINKDLTKNRNLNTFKMYCKRRKSSARFRDREARNSFNACHCIARNGGRRCLSTRERTSFVAVPQTENGRVLSSRADNLPSFAFSHVSQTFEELFHRSFHDWTRSR